MMRSTVRFAGLGAAFLLLSLTSACGDSDDTGPTGPPGPPTVMSSSPSNAATGVPPNGAVRVTFSEAMDPSTLTATTFRLTSGASTVPIPGTVIATTSTATFWPSAHFASSSAYTATVTTGARSASGVGLAANHIWSFTTGNTNAAGLPVDLGTASSFVILAKSGISTVPTSTVTGNIGVSPAAASYITGFSLTSHFSNVYATSQQVDGRVYAANYAQPTPVNMTAAVADMGRAFTDAAGRAADVTELGAGNIGGLTLAPGIYRWSTGLLIPTSVTLSGSAADVWIFQIAQGLTFSSAASVLLTGGAVPHNVFWQVTGAVTLGTTAHCEGVVLAATSVALAHGASIKGRLLAQTAVTIDGSAIVEPAQ